MGTFWRSLLPLSFVLSAASGCTSVLGDFSSGGGASVDGGSHLDANVGGGDTGVGSDAHADSPSSDGSSSGGGDAGDDGPVSPPPPPAGNPGFDLTSGGGVSTSTHFKLIHGLGEAPGGHIVGHSINYTFKSGVVAGTQ